MSSSSILVVGATGNTGVSTVKFLSQLISSLPSSSKVPRQIIALTRNATNTVSKQLAQLDHVKLQEKDWTSIKSEWLIEAKVARVYLAPHNLPHQFVDESKFLIACKTAKVDYLVKLSTNIHFIRPDSHIYYGRSHWAIENLLEQTEFRQLNWTVLRANVFISTLISPSVDWLKKNKTNGPIPVLLDEKSPIALVDPKDVGEAAAKLLALDDPFPHYEKKYNLSGPEDVTGEDVVLILEQITHRKIEANYRNIDAIRTFVEQDVYPESAWDSMEYSFNEISWKGVSRLANTPTSPEILQLSPPHSTVKEFVEQAFNH